MTTTSAATARLLESTIYHLVLPPQVPSSADPLELIEPSIVERVLQATRQMILQQSTENSKFSSAWEAVRRSLQACKHIHTGRKLNKPFLASELRQLQVNDFLILNITEQNAALLIRRQKEEGDSVIFEAFETSARSRDVLASKSALQWDFPGRAVSIPFEMFNEKSFQSAIVAFLEKGSIESIKDFSSKAFKSDTTIFELRDSVGPTLILQIFMDILEALGKCTNTTLLKKRVRDDVCWSEGANKPWRRSPMWLVLRVSIQRYMSLIFDGEIGRCQYKFLQCLIFAQLIDDARSGLADENIDLLQFLKTKLCRRLVKLEADMRKSSEDLQDIYAELSERLGPLFERCERNASKYLDTVWARIRIDRSLGCREVPKLPLRAHDRHLNLLLRNSGSYLNQILDEARWRQVKGSFDSISSKFDLSVIQTKSSAKFFTQFLSTVQIEEKMHAESSKPAANAADCLRLSNFIQEYLRADFNIYNSNPEQKSIMLLILMNLWMAMDQSAIATYPLLRQYDPWFRPDLLDILQLWRPSDIQCLQVIRGYIQQRLKGCGGSRMTIFSDPQSGCFAERYYDESADAAKLLSTRQEIESDAEDARARKEQEWMTKAEKYEELSRQIDEGTCIFTTDEYGYRFHDDRSCKKCLLEREAQRIRINGLEHPLPSDEVQAKAVIFELTCPPALVKYREATWSICRLALPKLLEDTEHKFFLYQYSPLNSYTTTMSRGISLASRKKSWLSTHYARNIYFPVKFQDVYHPSGMKFMYVDSSTDIRTRPSAQSTIPSFAHHCELQIPEGSPFRSLCRLPQLSADANGFTSYEVIASQSLCPPSLNVHEYMAYQALASGKTRRWPQILVEMGSNNLNFSTEATAALIQRLVLQIGPYSPESPLGCIHGIVQDVSFCKALLEQIDHRLNAIATNWRETVCMETLITLALRVFVLCSGARNKSLAILRKARETTYRWTTILRADFLHSTNAGLTLRISNYALWAALLCRRTFEAFCDSDETLTGDEVQCFLEVTMSIQDNLVEDPLKMGIFLRKALVRDFRLVYLIRDNLRRSVEENHASVISALISTWPMIGSSVSSSCQIGFIDDSYQHGVPDLCRWWIVVELPPNMYEPHRVIHINLLEGHLLVMGQPIGKLPDTWAESFVIRELFPQQKLRTYPSSMPGMTHTLAIDIPEHQIHIGNRNGELVLQACFMNSVLEFVPWKKFVGARSRDLPRPLIDRCTHWLDLNSGVLEVRPASATWRAKASNWQIDVKAGRARRYGKVTQVLVDPHSGLFSRVANLFAHFEYASNLVVFQPIGRGRLTIQLPNLELSFSVNNRNLLESRQLRAEFDPNQDAGTWYGLVSKIVLRSVTKTPEHSTPQRQRSVIVPMGPISYKRFGFHMRVQVENDDTYARFAINDILGRLDCAAEPRLIYLKAMYHAYTSFFLPDPLTRRTGTEEAIYCLSSGSSQPWSPLSDPQHLALPLIANLTPRRGYYPPNLKNMQTTVWDPNLTTTIQDDCFRELVESIRRKSNDLSFFATKKCPLPDLVAPGDVHLTQRGQIRRQLFQRKGVSNNVKKTRDTVYISRDKSILPNCRQRIMDFTSLIYEWPPKIYTTSDLIGIFHNLPQAPQPSTIGGFVASFDKVLLTDLLELDLVSQWGPLVKLCQDYQRKDRFTVIFLFAIIAFSHGSELDMALMRTLLAFVMLEDMKKPIALSWPSYTGFQREQQPTLLFLSNLIQPSLAKYQSEETEMVSQGFALSSKLRKRLQAGQRAHDKQQEQDIMTLSQFLLAQWPCVEPSLEDFTPSSPLLINLKNAMAKIRPEWLRVFKNWELFNHLSEIQIVLTQHASIESSNGIRHKHAILPEQDFFTTRPRGGEFPDLSALLQHFVQPKDNQVSNSTSSIQTQVSTAAKASQPCRKPLFHEEQELNLIADQLKSSSSAVRRRYGEDLHESVKALRSLTDSAAIEGSGETWNQAQLNSKLAQANRDALAQFQQIIKGLEGVAGARWLQRGLLWPITSPTTLLENLRSTTNDKIGKSLKEMLVSYGVAITAVQRLRRIEDASQKGNQQKFTEETNNQGHTNWKPIERPDWLLLEIDANLLLRPTQVDVAIATISPSSGSNSVLQMNMGQGKTSCIIPMAAAALANGKALVRVIVPKSLLLQTAQLLHARIGGMIGREIRHVPFSRKTATDISTTSKYKKLHNNIMQSSGIMLALPENLLSFKLSGLQQLSDARIPEAQEMIKVQTWMSQVSRDIIDEADSILAIRTQLIYPSGAQKTVDGHPHRWLVAQSILHLVEGHLWNLETAFPNSIEVLRRALGGFPVISFLRKDVEDELIQRLISDVLKSSSSILPQDCPKAARVLIRKFISEPRVSRDDELSIRKLFPDNPATKQSIYLLRGLFVHRILLMSLKKRWNVQYGLHPARDPIAVPYMAKGTPSDQAEWGHPDVAILFTCLSFYYQGLSFHQFRQALEHVMKSDDPAQIYDRFAAHINLPGSLQDWNSINVEDEQQIKDIWAYARCSMTVVDYFLNTFVFPRHAKQFRMKLQASGWDLPLFSMSSRGTSSSSQNAEVKPLSTGFSGTNDWKRMLPLTINQRDLPGLAHTNAEVLTYLLQPRNRKCVLAQNNRGGHLSEYELLRCIHHHKIRVLIDAGASILEMTNADLVRVWLDIDTEAHAAVYFNEDNKAIVWYRNGNRTPLLASNFADDLSDCLVYLDEAHTRGTDLKIPPNACGALTLGLGQTKDHTVQAAMRLRQLGTTQSVKFFVPPGVYQNIMDLRKKPTSSSIDSFDIISWLVEETCNGIEQLQPLYFSQGADFCRRLQATVDNPDFLSNDEQRESLLNSLRQMELQSLERTYGILKSQGTKSSTFSSPELQSFMNELNNSRKAFQDTGAAVHGSALQEVEQEREVAHEVETVREVQKMVKYDPFAWRGIHRDLEHYARTGSLTANSAGYELAFTAMQRTAVGRRYRINTIATSGRLFVSKQFTRTVILPHGQSYDNFQRNVNWVLWSGVTNTAIIVIPEEAEQILSMVNAEKPIHLIAYSAPVTRKMLHFGNLNYFAAPQLPSTWVAPMWLKVELGIYAGRLYFDYHEYAHLLEFLGIESAASPVGEELEDLSTAVDGACDSSESVLSREESLPERPKFSRKPLTFLQEWLAVRRKNQDFAQTPMGYVCQGKPLFELHPFFGREEDTTKEAQVHHAAGICQNQEQEVDDQEGFEDDEDFKDGQEVQDEFDDGELDNEERISVEDAVDSGKN